MQVILSLLESIQDGNTTEYFGYDDNGNLHRHAADDEDWIYFWDEANRLRSAVINGVKMMHYIYDASGERTLKAQTEYQGVFENGTPTDEGSTLTVYTTYPSPYLTISPDKKFTNHYYAGSQRIASKPAGNADRFNVMQVGDTLNLEELRAKQLADAQFVADSMELGQLNLAQPGSGVIFIPVVFYFHPDHLGSSTLITDNFGDPYQFFLNLPFGETFAEQRRNGSFNNPYKFNGKELDEETGLYYYGARYYNPRTSVFISVDPLTEQTMTPYQYTYQNPVRYIDPTGMAAEGWGERVHKNGKSTWEYSHHITKDNYKDLGYSDYIDSGNLISTTNGVADGKYNYSLNADGTVQNSQGAFMRNKFKTKVSFLRGGRMRG